MFNQVSKQLVALHSSQRDNSTEYRKRANFPESIEFSGISLYYTNEVYECPCNFAISR